MNTMAKFVVGAIIVIGLIGVCSESLMMGKAEALIILDGFGDPYECDVNKTCTRWAYGWHPQHQRVRNEVTTVDVRGWKCTGWEFPKGGIIPACDNEIMTREAGR